MLPDLLDQLCAVTGCPPPSRADGVLRPGSQADRIYQLIDGSDRAWTIDDLVVQTGITRNSVTIAVWRLKRLGLLERTGEEPAATKPRALYAAT